MQEKRCLKIWRWWKAPLSNRSSNNVGKCACRHNNLAKVQTYSVVTSSTTTSLLAMLVFSHSQHHLPPCSTSFEVEKKKKSALHEAITAVLLQGLFFPLFLFGSFDSKRAILPKQLLRMLLKQLDTDKAVHTDCRAIPTSQKPGCKPFTCISVVNGIRTHKCLFVCLSVCLDRLR